ncbi:hypothetical protein [Planomonospora venezuelensis]|uniref:Uncharacterized protein n=1 Tax=Planomonospora venezuelensis TaxID=1999 RepID=A0A841DIW3_PLAVE|nr:hypothetical protein [Planomonospora venezuelensis]MBB5968015.1 hypothetical protein [Planomonospora venezuelensis]GIN05558.1 hypothetical protein Pve01_72160 [Planomonospora venezuelensis]
MKNPEQALPAENQWDLLVEHNLYYYFHGLWVESDDPEEVSRLLRVDPETRLECDLETLIEMYQGPQADTVWIGPHAPGWTHVIAFGLYSYHPAIRNLAKRRVFEICYDDDQYDLDLLYFYYDGERIGNATPPEEEGGHMHLSDYRVYANGLALGEDRDLRRHLHLMLCMVGRITGRFLDQEWFTSTRTLYRIPEGNWEENW